MPWRQVLEEKRKKNAWIPPQRNSASLNLWQKHFRFYSNANTRHFHDVLLYSFISSHSLSEYRAHLFSPNSHCTGNLSTLCVQITLLKLENWLPTSSSCLKNILSRPWVSIRSHPNGYFRQRIFSYCHVNPCLPAFQLNMLFISAFDGLELNKSWHDLIMVASYKCSDFHKLRISCIFPFAKLFVWNKLSAVIIY